MILLEHVEDGKCIGELYINGEIYTRSFTARNKSIAKDEVSYQLIMILSMFGINKPYNRYPSYHHYQPYVNRID